MKAKKLILLLLIILPLGAMATSTLHIKFKDGSRVDYRAHQYWTDFIIKEGYSYWNQLPERNYVNGEWGESNPDYICIADCSISSDYDDYYQDYVSLNNQPFNSNEHYLSPNNIGLKKSILCPDGYWWYLQIRADQVESISVD